MRGRGNWIRDNRNNNLNIGRDNDVESLLDQFMEEDDDEFNVNNSMLRPNNNIILDNSRQNLFGNISMIRGNNRPNDDFDNLSNEMNNDEDDNYNIRGNNRNFRGFNRGGNRGGFRGNRGGNRGRAFNRGGNRGRAFNRGGNRGFNRGGIRRDDIRRNDDFYERENNNIGFNRRNNSINRRDDINNSTNRRDESNNNDNSGFDNNINRSNIQNQRRRNSFISFDKMKELYYGELNKVYEYLMSFPNYENLINGTEFKILMISMFMNILRRMSEDNSETSYQIISNLIDNTTFFNNQVKSYLSKKDIDIHYLNFVNDYLTFYKRIMERFRDKHFKLNLWSLGELVQELIKKCENVGENIKDDDEVIKFNEIAWNIIDNYNEIMKKKQEDNNLANKFKNLNLKIKQNDELDKYPIDYQKQEVEITKKELLNEEYEKKIAKHITKGSYKSYERYFNTIFYLTYEDCYRDLKYTISNLYNENEAIDPKYVEKKYKDIYFYFNASIPGIEATNDGIILTIEFEAPKIIKFTKRMIYGSLLILTDENWNDFLLITVFHNPYLTSRNTNLNR